MFAWERHRITDVLMPPGYRIVEIHNGYGSPDPCYEAYEGQRRVGAYPFRDDAVEACREDAKRRGWAKSRYDLIGAEDEPKLKPGCAQCGETHDQDGAPVLWRCHMCDRIVCRDCTLTIPGSQPTEYFTMTLCSHACWEKAGRPDE